ncbi:disease resistance protein RUN1-like [Macadamia integrifolia]|uniref:disease resistance protein RUN1-like n=1 Tax=Macadamia integrifolia TaxID=60698 RepID=UPI001C4E7CA8|nr:disease resistance protein RUN1-like [Macadamia integrifolia]
MINKRIREAVFSSSSSSISRWNPDLFLSTFSQDASNKIIIDDLYNALIEKGIRTIREDEEDHKRREKAIERSRIAIVLFSRKYVSSIWCLDELLKILEFRSSSRTALTVLPVFCDVDPSDVRKQTGSLEEAFARYGELFKDEKEKVERWRAALTKVANLSGWDLHSVSNGQVGKFIQRIVNDVVLIKRSRTPLNIACYLVGIDSRVATLMNSYIYLPLCVHKKEYLSPCEVRIIGICGFSGLGKTTIAKAVYNKIYHRFEGCSFLENVREVSQQPNGLTQLQEQLLSDVLVKKNLKISNVDRGINMIKQRLHCKRVLIVIDDVDHPEQLNALAIKHDSFGIGRRIIVISRDEHLLNEAETCQIYHPEELDSRESLQLFSWHAFKNDSPPDDYKELSKEVVGNVKGHPLALEVMGSSMFGKRSLSEWENVLAKLKRTPGDQIQKKLRLSFYDLDDTEKDIFLDIACFFIGMDQSYVSKILDGCNLFPDIGIRILIQKSLITIDRDQKLRMHDLLREMAKEIVREESPEQSGKRTRLWSREDVCDVLVKHEGTKSVEGIILNISQFEDVCFNTEAFVGMHDLRLLQLNNVSLRGGYEHLSKKLRCLCWHGFPLNSIPTDFDMENLIVLHMENSCVNEVWKEIKLLKRLKILNLSHSSYLTKTPNFSGVPNLEELILEDCKSLVEVHRSIGYLDKLFVLNLRNCNNLKKLPDRIGMLRSLEELILEDCESLVEVHQSIGYLDKLIVLNLKNCNNLLKLPDSIGMLRSLEELNLYGCSKLVQSTSWFSSFPQYLCSLRRKRTCTSLLPASFSGLCSLIKVDFSYCNLSEDLIPNDFWSLPLLNELKLEGNRLCTLPASIRHLSRLESLTLRHCGDLKLMTDLPSSLSNLDLEGCSKMEILPSNISDLSRLLCLNLNGCRGLQSFPKLSSHLKQLLTSGCTSLHGIDVVDLQYLRYLVVNYDYFCSKSDEISCLPNLEILTLEGCESPQTLPKLPSNLETMFVDDDITNFQCEEIQSMETSQSMQCIRVEECRHLGNTLRKNSLFQDIHRGFEVWGRGSEIPEWISHQNMGSSISFEVSACLGCKIQGLDVSAVFSTGKELELFRSITVIYNKTKDIQWEPIVGTSQLRRHLFLQLWVRHVTIAELRDFSECEVGYGNNFEVGDQVEVSVEILEMMGGGSLQVKRCGVLLVHRPDEEKNLSDDRSMVEYMSASVGDVVMDRKESVLVHIEDENESGHNEGIAGFGIDAKRLGIGL